MAAKSGATLKLATGDRRVRTFLHNRICKNRRSLSPRGATNRTISPGTPGSDFRKNRGGSLAGMAEVRKKRLAGFVGSAETPTDAPDADPALGADTSNGVE